MFIWNIEDNTMQHVADLDLRETSRSRSSGTLTSDTIAGVAIEGVPEFLWSKRGIIESKIAAQSRFEAIDAVREGFGGEISALSKFVAELVEEGQDADLTFRPRDQRYRVVVIRSVVRARRTEIRIGGVSKNGEAAVAKISIQTPAGDLASIAVDASDLRTCQARDGAEINPVCFFNVVVYDPTYVVDNPRLQWVLTNEFPRDELPDAFRSIR